MASFPSIDRIAALLAGRAVASVTVDAAVMLCLREREVGTEVLICRRAERHDDPWSGHMSLPGGRLEPGEGPLAAAIRETVEEVGFDPIANGSLLGPLDPLHGRMQAVPVAPFAVRITTDVEPSPSDELAAAWWAPLGRFVERDVTVRELAFPVPALVGIDPDGAEAVVWGMTYRLLASLSALDSV